MGTDRKWVIVRIDGKIAAVSTDYRMLSEISSKLAGQKTPQHMKVCAETVGFDYIWSLRKLTTWDDFMLFGTAFQKKVWRKLYELTHVYEDHEEGSALGSAPNSAPDQRVRFLSYSDFAELCENRAGVRAVAHAVGLNPLAVLIPCHMVVPKEAIDKMREIQKKAESTIFRGSDLCMDSILRDTSIDFGEYALGRSLKRDLIQTELL
jgi:O6-methylguanine-DNA--protein-cysteine methyltransferase